MDSSMVSVGLIFVLIGLGTIFLLWASARIARGQRGDRLLVDAPTLPIDLASSQDAVIVANTGGQVVFVNAYAHRWFGMEGGDADLWLIAQQLRPADSFLQLFAAEGRAMLQMADRRVEATSHRVRVGDVQQFIVVLREQAPAPALDKEDRDATRAMLVISEISRAISASLDLEATLNAILNNLVRLVRFNTGELCLWEPDKKVLRPVGRTGDTEYHAQIDQSGGVYHLDEGYSGWIARHHQPLVIPDLARRTDVRPKLDLSNIPYRSYIGVPLMVRNRFIGTLELTSTEPGAYDAEDLSLLNIVADQAAIAIENARLYGEQEERVAELSGLQQISSALGTLQDPYELYRQLNERIASLMDVELCAVLLYDEDAQALVPEIPVHGVPDNIAQMYRIPLDAGSPARALWDEMPFWFTNDVPGEEIAADLELKGIATAVGVVSTAMAPMTVGNERIGVVQVSNKRDGSPFALDDIRLLQIYAAQAAIVVENARLYSGEQNRVAELQGLQKISQAMSAITDPEQLYAQLSNRIGELMGVEMCGVLLYDEEADALVSRPPFYGVDDDLIQGYRLSLGQSMLAQDIWRERDVYISNDVLTDPLINELGLMDLTRATGVRSTIFVPLSSTGRRFGVIQVSNKRDESDFDQDDARILSIFASQAAALIENARLYEETDDNLRNRIEELRSVSRVSRELNATLELDRILRVISEEAVRAEGAACGGILLLDTDENGSGSIRNLHFGCQGEHPNPLETHVLESGDVLAIEDFRTHTEHVPPHDGVRSALVVPIHFEGKIVGVVELHSDKPDTLGPSAVEFVTALSDQAAIALGNATRYAIQVSRGELLRKRAEQLTQIFELSRLFRSDQSMEESLDAVAHGIQEAVGFGEVVIAVMERSGQRLHNVAVAGLPLTAAEEVLRIDRPIKEIQDLMRDEFAISGSYFIPHDGKSVLDRGREWHPDDQLIVPLRSTGGILIGLLTVDAPHDKALPSQGVVETLEIFANQAAVVIENSRLYRSMEDRAEELSQSLEDLEKSYEELDTLSRDMIHKDMELSHANERLDRRAQRLLAVHRTMESIDTTQPPADVLQAITQAVVREMDVDVCMVLLKDNLAEVETPLQVVASAGKVPKGADIAARLTREKIIVQTYSGDRGNLVIYDDGQKSAPLAAALAVHSVIALPLDLGDNKRGVILVGNQHANATLTEDDIDLFTLLSSQTAVEYENARLYQAVQDEAASATSERDLLQNLHFITTALQQTRDLNIRLKTITTGLQTLGYGRVMLILFDRDMAIIDLTLSGYTENEEKKLRQQLPSGEEWLALFEDPVFLQKRIGSSYYLPVDDPWVQKHIWRGKAPKGKRQPGRWHPDDLLYLPMYAASRVIGLISLSQPQDEALLTQDTMRPLELFSQQAASALENTRLYQEAADRSQELEILFEAGQAISASLDLNHVLTSIGGFLTQAIPLEGYNISLWNEADDDLTTLFDYADPDVDRETLKSGTHFSLVELPPSYSKALQARELVTLYADDRTADRDDLAWMKREGLQSRLVLPLVTRGMTVGLLQVWHATQVYRFTELDLRLGQVLANQIATALENARLHDETQQRVQELATINQIGRAITSAITSDDLHDTLYKQISAVVGNRSMLIATHDTITRTLTFPLVVRDGEQETRPAEPFGEGLYAHVVKTGKPLLLGGDVARQAEAMGITQAELGLKSFLAIPFFSAERAVGVLAVMDYEVENAFDQTDLRILETTAAQVGVSIQNARLYDQIQRRLGETTALQEVSRVVNSSLDLGEIFEGIVAELAYAFDYPLIALSTVEGDVLRLQAYHGYEEEDVARFREMPLTRGVVGRVARTGAPVYIQDVSKDQDYVPTTPWVVSQIVVPISSDQRVLGALSIESGADHPLSPNDMSLLTTLTSQVATAMENARLYDEMLSLSSELERRVAERTRELQEERDTVDTLYRITSELSSSIDLDMVLNRGLALLGEAVSAEHGSIFLIEPQSERLLWRAVMSDYEVLPPGGREIPLTRGEGMAGWVIENRQAILVHDVQQDSRWVNIPGTEDRRSMLAAPLVANEDVLGVVIMMSDEPHSFTEGHLRLVEAAANQVATAINNAELFRLIRDQAERLGSMLRSQQVEASKSQAILESVADGVMVSNAAGEIILFNAAAERTLDLSRGEVLGRPSSEMAGLYGGGGERWAERMEAWMSDPSSHQEGEFLQERINVGEKVISVHLSPVAHGDEFLGLVSVFRDITREVEVDRMKSEFVSTVSHELRTPMTSIKGYADLLLMGAAGALTDEQQRYIDIIKNNADRLSLLVNDLLDISRIEQGRVDLEIRDISLADIVDELMTALEVRFADEEKVLRVTVDIPPDLPTIQADAERLTQILMNIVLNAYLYTPNGGSVTISAARQEDGVQVDVADTGIGIPLEDQDRIFERFYRGEDPVVIATAGTGLGLSIVRHLIEMHNGRVWFESELDKGTTFSVFFPYLHQHEQQQQVSV